MPLDNSRDFRVVEERQFTNPRVRFIRVNGRIVPIVNKQKVGQDAQRVGGALATVGAVGVGVSLAVRTKAAKSVAKFSRKAANVGGSFASVAGKMIKDAPRAAVKRGVVLRSVAASVRAGGKLVKFGARNPGRLGALALASGSLLSIYGNNLEIGSQFGKDILK